MRKHKILSKIEITQAPSVICSANATFLSEAGKPLLGFIHTLLTHSKTVQYSVYEIDNSEKILYNIIAEINNNFAKKFDQTDSVYIFKMSASCEIQKFGYAKNEDSVLLMV